jgi:hypothetical protein
VDKIRIKVNKSGLFGRVSVNLLFVVYLLFVSRFEYYL